MEILRGTLLVTGKVAQQKARRNEVQKVIKGWGFPAKVNAGWSDARNTWNNKFKK